ncbi:MAG TPA: hypothetical protein PK109_03905 [Candidatus Paceibacterota bacterium]|nr:hypothetical protein [Candidatus Paceibacterota bacterium]
MILSAFLFFVLSFITYFLIALFGHLTGGAPGTFWQSLTAAFKPLPLLLILLSNLCFAAALWHGFKITAYAIPISIAIGVIASFTYSIAILHASVTPVKLLGVMLILLGIYFLR